MPTHFAKRIWHMQKREPLLITVKKIQISRFCQMSLLFPAIMMSPHPGILLI